VSVDSEPVAGRAPGDAEGVIPPAGGELGRCPTLSGNGASTGVGDHTLAFAVAEAAPVAGSVPLHENSPNGTPGMSKGPSTAAVTLNVTSSAESIRSSNPAHRHSTIADGSSSSARSSSTRFVVCPPGWTASAFSVRMLGQRMSVLLVHRHVPQELDRSSSRARDALGAVGTASAQCISARDGIDGRSSARVSMPDVDRDH
jgi:hypothetical protein